MSNDYELVVGLEVHAELSTESKIYCSCKNEFGLEVNSVCCPICTGMPGTLPTLNEKVVEYAIKMGHAMNCNINYASKQDRKNYFYPDLPKAYQISQSDIPICENGFIDVLVDDGSIKRIGITRIHIEEDAGKLIKTDRFDGTLIDFNRCGVPLIEIVSEPDIRTSKQAHVYLKTIKSYLIYLGISDAKMQEGSIRCDVNVSVRKRGQKEFGTRCEMKNVNTFSGAVKAIEYEYKRQIEILESGGKIIQQTRRWDDEAGKTISMRSKEDAQDYRYFPEPDLKTIVVSKEKIKELKDQIPEMPNYKAMRYIKDHNISQTDSELLASNLQKATLFDDTIDIDDSVDAKMVANWILITITQYVNKTGKRYDEIISPKQLSELILYIQSGKISNSAGKKVFNEITSKSSKSVKQIVLDLGLEQISNEYELNSIVKQMLKENEKSINDYKNGKTNALGYLVGQCMKATKGKGNPAMIKEFILKYLKSQ